MHNMLEAACLVINQSLLMAIVFSLLAHLWSETQTTGRGWRPPVKYFTDRSKAILLLRIFYGFMSCVCYAFVHVCLYVLCGHLLGKG